MKISFSSSFLEDLERIDNVVAIDGCTISGRNYKPQVVNHNGVVQACIVGVEVDECDKLDFYYNDEHKLAFTITSDSPIRLNRERTIFKFNLLDIGRPIRAEITCSWLTEDTKFIESIGLDLGYSLYKDIEISSDTLIWKNSIGKYIVDRGLQDDHRYDAERLDTKSGILEDRPIRFKSYQNIIIDPGNWKIDYEKRTIVQKHDVYSEISSSVFYVWDSPMIDAKVNYNVEPECIERLGEYLDPGNIVFGNTDCFQFINFQSGVLKGFRITGTEESEIEFLFNREYASGPYTSFRAKIGKDGVVEIKIPEDLLYTHLNGIITVGPSKITKIETIQYIEEPVDIIVPNPDSTYVVEIGNSDCIVQINASCDYIEYEKYLGKITEIGRGTEHINSIPGVEIIISEKGDGGLDSKINQLERQIECYYNSSTYESVHTDIFQVIIDKNIIVSGDSISTERLVSDYKIKIEQTGIVWRITNSPDYTYTEELIGGTRDYGIFLLDFPQNSSRTLEIITNQLDYTDDLIIVADEHVNNTFTFNPVRRIPPAEERGWLIDGEYWNIYDLIITTKNENENEEWTPQVEGSQQNPYIIKIKYGLSNEIIESLSFCAIQLGKIEPKISIWEETLPGKFTKVEDGKMTIFDSLVKNFIVVRSHKGDDPEDHNWYYYDLNGTNKFFLTDFNSTTTNVGIVFLDYFNKTTLDIGTGEDRVKFGRIINVNRSDLIGSLGVLTVTENSSYPGSWRELINNNTANVEIFREKTNIYIEVGTGDNLENKDLTLEVSKIGIYSIKVRSNYKYIIETNNSGYFRFIDETSTTQTSESLNDNIKKEVYKGYNSIIEYKLALVRLDQEEGMEKTYIEIRSGTLVRRINVVVKDPVYASHSYLTEITTVNEGAIETQEIEKPNIIRIYENGSLTPQENVNFYYSSYTTPKIDYSNLANVSDTTSSSFIYYSDLNLKDYVYHKSSVNFTVPNSLSLSYSKYPIKSFGGINESSLSFSSLEGNPLEYLFYMKGKGHYLWGVDNISDFSDIGNVNDDTFKDITFDASGTQGRDVYVISRYSINNKTFTTEYPEISEINIKRNDLEATLTISPQQKISLDAKSQIEYAIPIHATCNIVNNQGNVFIGSLTYKAETKVTDASLEDVIEIPSNIIDQELGGSEEEIKNYLTNYILGVGETHKLPKQEFTLRIFQRGTSTDSLSIFSDISDFGVNESTKYIIPEVGSNRDVSDVKVMVNDELINPTTTIGGLTFTEEHSSSYFLVTAHEDDLIGDDGQYWYETDLPGDDVIQTKTFNISISSDKNKDFSYTKTIKKYGYNYGLLVNNSVSTWFGFGNAKSEKNKKAWSPAISIPAEGGKVLIKAGIFYAVDGKQSTEALSIPFEYKFVGENIPDNVVWEGGNLDELNEFDEPGGNLYITVPPRLRDDFGEKHFILQVTQPHEYYPLNLYVDFAQKSFYNAETEDKEQDNYKLVFEKKELNVYSNGQVEGETDKIYFTHNLNEEAFNRVEFDWVGRTIIRRVTPKEGEPYEEEKQTYIPFSPDDLSFLEEVERNYKEGYVKFKFKPNGSREFIYAKLRAKYRKDDSDDFIILGEMDVNQGYYCINATYVNPYMKSKISNFIYLSTNMSRISPKALITGLISEKPVKAYYYGECPCYTNNDNLNASGSDSFIKGRGVIYIKAYRLEFYQNDNNNIVEVDSEGIEKDEIKYETGEKVLKIFNNIDILNNTNSNVLDSLNAILISETLVNDFDAKVSDRFKIDSSIYVTSTNFSNIKDTIYAVPYIDIIYKCKEDYIRERTTISVSCKVSLIEEDLGNNSDFYFTLSSIKEASNEPPSIDSLTVNPTKLMFDYRGGQKQVSFSPTSMRDMITVTMIPDKDNWITVTPAASNSNFITFTATENKSTDSKTAYYRTCQAKLDIEDSRDHYLLKSFLIDIEQQSDTSGSGSGGGGDDPDPPTPTGDVNIKLKLVNDRTDKDLELNGEVIIYVDDGEGYHVGISANIPGYDITQNNLIVAKGTSSETFSITCAKTESVNPVEYLGNSIDFVHSKEGCKAYTMNGGGHDSDIYKPYKVSILEGGVTFEKNKTYIITFHEEGAGTAPNLPLMSDFNEVLTTELNKEKVTLEYTPKTSDYLTSAMNLATSEWNSGSLFNIVNETGVDIVNYRGSNLDYEENARISMYAWLYAMCLSEIIPSYSPDMKTDNNQTILYKEAYELGGGRDIPLYGNFTPKGDCMVARLVAGILWAKNRSGYSFNDLDTMRSELGGQIIDKPDTPWTDFGYVDNTRIGWLVNLDKIFPAAPGPFANGYDNGRVRPSSQGQDYSLFFSPSESQYNWWSENYKIDVSIDNTVVSGYNLQMEDVDLSRTVQAVADDTEDVTHMFGEKTYYKYDATKTTVVDGITVQGPRFTFTPGTPTDNNGFFYGTFGSEVTGVDLSSILSSGNDDTETDFSYFMGRSRYIGSHGRYPLLNPQYGRRRPSQGLENPSSRDTSNYRLNWLDDTTIAKLVGSGTKYDANGQDYNLYWDDINGNGKYDVRHLNSDGEWVDAEPFYNDGITETEEDLFHTLYANTYPSGHSSGVWGTALCTTLFFPDKYKEIFRAAYKFSVSRTIVRAHWNSDITYGRTIGTMIIPISHAIRYNNSRYGNYRTLYSRALKQATGGGDDPDVDEALSACYDYCINEADNQDPPRDDLDYLKQTSTNNGRYIVFNITNNTGKHLIWGGRIAFFVLDDPNNPTGERTQIYGFYRIYNDTDSQGYHHSLYVNPSNYLIKPGEVIRVKVPMARQYDAVDLEGKRLATTIRSSKGKGDYFRLYVLKTDLDDDYALHADSIALIDQTSYNNPVLTNGAEYNLVMTADLFDQSLVDGNKYYLNSESEYNASKSYCLSASGSNYAPMRLSDWS